MTARRVDHVWQIDLTLMPMSWGLWVPWVPQTWIARWPFAWWLGVVLDTFSRRIVGFQVYRADPSGEEIAALIADCVAGAGGAPKYIVSDKGPQFVGEEYRDGCRAHEIEVRYAAADSLRATAMIERFFRSLKSEWLRRVPMPFRNREMIALVQRYLDWYHEHRPHQGLGGRTPNEVVRGGVAANALPRLELRPRWPRGSGCAAPQAKARPRSRSRGHPIVAVDFVDRDQVLPIVAIKLAA